MNVLCCSGGNDSVALLQWARVEKLKNVHVLYNNTGWAADRWGLRMNDIKSFCSNHGFRYGETKCEGFKAMVRRKKGFPMPASKMQFCTSVLKTEPTKIWLQENDPEKKAIIYIGIRREESTNRSNHPYEILFHEKYNGRLQRFPLVEYTEKDRDFLIDDAGLDILLHSSMECFPCVNSNRSDLRMLSKDEKRVRLIEKLEKEMGFTSKNKPRVMFRPKRHQGATGIREVIKWAFSNKGEYLKYRNQLLIPGFF